MITERAMLAAVHISIWTAIKHDRKISRDVADQHGAHQGPGRYNKQLLRGADKLDELRTLAGQVRQYFYKITLPWSDEGFRLLPSNLYVDLTARMREFEASFEQGVDNQTSAMEGSRSTDAVGSSGRCAEGERAAHAVAQNSHLLFPIGLGMCIEEGHIGLGVTDARVGGRSCRQRHHLCAVLGLAKIERATDYRRLRVAIEGIRDQDHVALRGDPLAQFAEDGP